MLKGTDHVHLRLTVRPVSGFFSLQERAFVAVPATATSSGIGAKASRASSNTPACLNPVTSFCFAPSSLSLQTEKLPVTRPVARVSFT